MRGFSPDRFLLAFALVGCSAATLRSQDASGETTVEEIRCVLDSIHPYLPASEVTAKVDIFGSSVMDGLAHGWAIGFDKFHPKAEVVVSAEGSETVFDRLAENPSSIGMLSRPVLEEDLAELRDRGLADPVAVRVAREALGVFVHQDNPLESITHGELVQLFGSSGRDRPPTWGVVGLAGEYGGQPVILVSRGPRSGTRKFIEDYIFRGAPLRQAGEVCVSNLKLIREVEKNRYAVAISGLKCGSHAAKPLRLKADNVTLPSDDHSILVGNYPLTRPLTLVLDVGRSDERSAASREFVRYALSQAGQTQAILTGFFPSDPPTLRAEMLKVDSGVGQGHSSDPSAAVRSTRRRVRPELAR